jgi:general secretion pathway protein I
MKRHSPCHLSRGFTLLEVLVALAIFVMAAIVLGASYVNVLNAYAAAARGRDSDEDVKFARQQLLIETDVKKIEEGGEFDSTGGRHVRWTATAEPTTIPDLFTVTFNCEISAMETPEPQKITQTFMLMRPTWSDAGERSKLQADIRSRIAEIQGTNKQ